MTNERIELRQWPYDGEGRVRPLPDGGWRIDVVTPFTLWCPHRHDAGVEVAFRCTLHTPNSAMLVMACARAWRGEPDVAHRRGRGGYAEYAYGDLEMYTVGFNRTAHVANDVQPNASMANVRRIGGPEQTAFADVDLRDRSDTMKRRWAAWDHATLLCCVREPQSGVGRPYHYRMRFDDGRVSVQVDQQPLLVVDDHHADPLRGGYFAIRNMTPGAKFDLHDLAVGPVTEK